jgi:dipeptidyl aminopeptidase/acylaminoacyl peptidase
MTVVPYGNWPSPLTPAEVVGAASQPTSLHAAGGTLWFSETRPQEGGREAIVRVDPDGAAHEVLPADFDARTAVHEYGGGAWWVHNGTVFATSWHDQRLYRIEPGGPPVPITPAPPRPRAWRYADGRLTPDGRWVICVRERHEGTTSGEVHNELVAFPADGSAAPSTIHAGRDFVAAPRVSRDGRQLAWIAWDHPNMPWDSTELWLGRLSEDAGALQLLDARREAGSGEESLVQPEWGRHNTLYVCTDRSDWWNVHRVDGIDALHPILPVDAEVSLAPWTFGQSRYVVLRDGTVVAAHLDGLDTVLTHVPEHGPHYTLRLPGQYVRRMVHDVQRLLGIVDLPDRLPEIRDLTGGDVLRSSPGTVLAPEWVSLPTRVSFPTEQGEQAHAWVYMPCNPEAQAPHGDLPPLLVQVHGGPTGEAGTGYSPRSGSGPPGGSPWLTWTIGAAQVWGDATGSCSVGSGGSSTCRTRPRRLLTWPRSERSTRGAWQSVAGAPAA